MAAVTGGNEAGRDAAGRVYARDRLHRETVRSFGSMAGSNAAYELTSTYTPQASYRAST